MDAWFYYLEIAVIKSRIDVSNTRKARQMGIIGIAILIDGGDKLWGGREKDSFMPRTLFHFG